MNVFETNSIIVSINDHQFNSLENYSILLNINQRINEWHHFEIFHIQIRIIMQVIECNVFHLTTIGWFERFRLLITTFSDL